MIGRPVGTACPRSASPLPLASLGAVSGARILLASVGPTPALSVHDSTHSATDQLDLDLGSGSGSGNGTNGLSALDAGPARGASWPYAWSA